MRQTLAGCTVLITGAGRGLGEGVARACAARGAQLALLDLDDERLAAVAESIGPRAAWWRADVTDGDGLDSAVEAAAAHFGGIDVAVANAGITAFAPVEKLDPDVFQKVIDVNLVGAWRTLRAALPHVRARNGYLLVVASMAAFLQSPLQAHYTASKAGVAALAESLRQELKGTGTRVGVAFPTFIATDMMSETTADPAGRLLWGGNQSGMNRMISADEAVAGIVRAIERRKRMTVLPRRLWPIALGPGYVRPFFAAQFKPDAVRAAAEAASPRGFVKPQSE